jgi:hypothetical protein
MNRGAAAFMMDEARGRDSRPKYVRWRGAPGTLESTQRPAELLQFAEVLEFVLDRQAHLVSVLGWPAIADISEENCIAELGLDGGVLGDGRGQCDAQDRPRGIQECSHYDGAELLKDGDLDNARLRHIG